MSIAPKIRLLQDITLAKFGYAGIPQDTARTFNMLCMLAHEVELGALVFSTNVENLLCSIPEDSLASPLIAASQFFARETEKSKLIDLAWYKKIGKPTFWKLALVYFFKRRFKIYPIPDKAYFSRLLWRVYFSYALANKDYEQVSQQNIYFSRLSRQKIDSAGVRSGLSLNTQGWDFILFQNLTPVKVSPNTIKLIRYHDSIPISDSDVSVNESNEMHSRGILACVKNSYFVCNSEDTRQGLLKLFPELKDKSVTLPLVIKKYQYKWNPVLLKAVLIKHFSSEGLQLSQKEKQSLIFSKTAENTLPQYIIAVSTLEPRKNYVSAIRAWDAFRKRHDASLKFIIVGNLGWKNELIKKEMQHYILSGDLIHLEHVLADDLEYLYSAASLCLFVSYNEGFGHPPLEAAQCQCPSVVSDIGAHREGYVDAVEYCDPYDIESIVTAMEKVLLDTKRKEELVKKGLAQAEKYSAENIAALWRDFLFKLHKEREVKD
jgi:glycosyltransferase involved in cell wall biosynthesis